MDVVPATLRWQRALLCAVLVVAFVGFWRSTYDVFNTFKATVLLLGTIGLVALGAYRVSRTRRLAVPWNPAVAAACVLAIAFIVATLVSPTPLLSVVGRPGRHTGLAMYLAYLVLFAITTRLHAEAKPAALAKTLLGAAVPVTVYGLLQTIGVEPFGWQAVEGGPQVFSTFGNANFFAAFLGIVAPLATWGALTTTWSAPWRAGSAALGVLALTAAIASNSLQGPAVAVVGAAFVTMVAIGGSPTLSRGRKAGFIGGGAALGVAGLIAVALGAGPFAPIRAGLVSSLGTRTPKWVTALAIWRDHPVTGVGLERYADHFFAYRPASLAAETGLRRTTDTPHDIPLDMLVNGGLVLGLAYLAFVGLTGWALVTGLRRTTGDDRLLLAGLGGAWLAYQLQSLVSIDVPPIAALHYVLAGAIVGLGTRPELRLFALPGAPPLAAPEPVRKGKRKGGPSAAPRPARTPLAPVNPLLLGILGGLGLAAMVIAVTPLRADAAAGRALRFGGDPVAAVDGYRRAGDIASWESRYPALLGGYLTQPEVSRAGEALDAHLDAARREPGSLAHALNVARLSTTLGQPEQADDWWERVLDLDPTTPEVLVEASAHWLARGDSARAEELAQRAVAVRDSDATLWVALGQARAAAQDTAAAREAFQRALELNPQVEGGAEGLAQLEGLA